MNHLRISRISPWPILLALALVKLSAQEIFPAKNDAATKATFKLVDGAADPDSASLDVLHDGKPPSSEDDPQASFFFAPEADGGRISIDLGSAIPVKSVTTSSLHPNARAPQLYELYASKGTAPDFVAAPKRGVDPVTCGWKRITSVDSRKTKGGDHRVVTAEPFLVGGKKGKAPGKYRYLLFDIKRPDAVDSLSNTFFNEIDVVDATAPLEKLVENPVKKQLDTVTSKDGKYHYVLDSTEAPDLRDWTLENLFPVMEKWYPKIIGILPVEGYTPADTVYFRLKAMTNLPDHPDGVPGYANRDQITLNARFLRDNKKGELIGCAVHEVTHVVQFAGSPLPLRAKSPPVWLFEGATDYIRWFLFEPETKGAEITKDNVGQAKYDDSYRVTANFMNWVIQNYQKDLMRKINLSIHQGYTPALWKEWTGKTLEELGAEWKKANEKRLGVDKA